MVKYDSFLYGNGLIYKITIAYYSECDRANYIDLFKNTKLQEIIEYKRCEDIFNWEDALH